MERDNYGGKMKPRDGYTPLSKQTTKLDGGMTYQERPCGRGAGWR